MAINILKQDYQNDDGLDAIQLEIANGDLAVLKKATDSYGVHDVTDMIAFAIAVLNEADGRPVAATNKSGQLVKFMPSAAITRNATEQQD